MQLTLITLALMGAILELANGGEEPIPFTQPYPLTQLLAATDSLPIDAIGRNANGTMGTLDMQISVQRHNVAGPRYDAVQSRGLLRVHRLDQQRVLQYAFRDYDILCKSED